MGYYRSGYSIYGFLSIIFVYFLRAQMSIAQWQSNDETTPRLLIIIFYIDSSMM
ncbi:hypothetical protein JCM10512_2395 [Bacteroides reticulotermitis JCM 10512]|uniref:Uncharacterized protein n=1 Tax=Bacteroides reticulotermitis JCM 10512 TaxID=1445607 RepID=W4USA1_9BACE|nr:hypothetical protein JCM10512_2395 [Bacteroides reticulotermitis JCM 10512]